VDGVCEKQKAAGEACTAVLGDCDFYQQELVCLPAKKICLKAQYVGEGEQRGAVKGQPVLCANGSCKPNALFGTCVTRAKDGDACDPVNGPDCEFHAECVQGKCVPIHIQDCH
jgi:hypothetical protein